MEATAPFPSSTCVWYVCQVCLSERSIPESRQTGRASRPADRPTDRPKRRDGSRFSLETSWLHGSRGRGLHHIRLAHGRLFLSFCFTTHLESQRPCLCACIHSFGARFGVHSHSRLRFGGSASMAVLLSMAVLFQWRYFFPMAVASWDAMNWTWGPPRALCLEARAMPRAINICMPARCEYVHFFRKEKAPDCLVLDCTLENCHRCFGDGSSRFVVYTKTVLSCPRPCQCQSVRRTVTLQTVPTRCIMYA